MASLSIPRCLFQQKFSFHLVSVSFDWLPLVLIGLHWLSSISVGRFTQSTPIDRNRINRSNREKAMKRSSLLVTRNQAISLSSLIAD